MLTGARAHLYLAISESIRVLLLSEWHRLISTASVRYILKIFLFCPSQYQIIQAYCLSSLCIVFSQHIFIVLFFSCLCLESLVR